MTFNEFLENNPDASVACRCDDATRSIQVSLKTSKGEAEASIDAHHYSEEACIDTLLHLLDAINNNDQRKESNDH